MAKETNWNAIVFLLILFGIIWLIWTGTIWYVFALIILGVAGYVVYKIYSAKEEEPITPQPTQPLQPSSTPQTTIIREKETIKEVVMIPCAYCHSLMPQTSTFCPHCGARRKA